MVGFNFASVEEARDLKNVVDQKILAKKRREGMCVFFLVWWIFCMCMCVCLFFL